MRHRQDGLYINGIKGVGVVLTLLHLLAAVSLLVWGTHIVRTGIMRVFGARLRRVLSHSVEKKWLAFTAGLGVTALVQSSNATALLVTSFVSQGLMTLAPALVIVLGADVGTALMARVLTFDLSWLSPLLIVTGVAFFLSRKQTRTGQLGRVGIGLGLILLALELIVNAATPITHATGVKVLFSSLTGDVLLDALTGAVFAIISYSSLAAVLLTATLSASSVISLKVSLCLVVGANLGSGILTMLNASQQLSSGRRVALGSLLFKVIGSLLILPFIGVLAEQMSHLGMPDEELVIYFHMFYNLSRCLLMLPFTSIMARTCDRLIADTEQADPRLKPRYLDDSAIDTPTLALANAARETLRLGDVIEQMLLVQNEVMHGRVKAKEFTNRALVQDVETLYTAIKLYLAQINKEGLPESENRRWAQIIEMSLNLEQSGDIIERMTDEISAKYYGSQQAFSAQGLSELDILHKLLLDNMRLSMSVFLSNDVVSARRLRRLKHRYRLLDQRYSHAHVERLHQHNVQSIETSTLHLGLLGDMKRLNSLFCSVVYNALGDAEREPEDDDPQLHDLSA
jgi:phosphate:Na+ symporter